MIWKKCDRELTELRIKVIVFRVYKWDFEPMVETEFFVMPEQEEELRSFVNGIEVRFNTGYAGNALEAGHCFSVEVKLNDFRSREKTYCISVLQCTGVTAGKALEMPQLS